MDKIVTHGTHKGVKQMNNHAILIGADDWEGLFVCGQLVEEGHTLNQGYNRVRYFQKLAKQYGFKLEEMQAGYVTESYEKTLEDTGGFPKMLYDVSYEVLD